MDFWRQFLRDEQGQDLIEYTLLIGFFSLASAALFVEQGGTINSIWTTASNQLTAAQAAGS